MSNRVYPCLRRTDIPEGKLQVLDLIPHATHRDYPTQPNKQTGYISFQPQNDTVTLSGVAPADIVTVDEYSGLAAYILDTVENTPTANTPVLTGTQANDGAAALITLMQAGSALGSAAINAALETAFGIVGAVGVGVGNSTATVEEILQILNGQVYTVPQGAVKGSGANSTFVSARKGAFSSTIRGPRFYAGTALSMSADIGALAKYKSSGFTYGGVAGSAVVIYDSAGAVI